MRAKLTALLIGAVLLGLAGSARADALTPTDAHALTLPALTDTWSLPSADGQAATTESTQVVTLTDAQLDNATAGTWYQWSGYWGFFLGTTFYQFYGNMWYWS